MTTADVVVIGGGVIGSSIAYHLRRDGFRGRVVVIERDNRYARASSALAMGGIRQQFTSAVNVAMAQYSARFYREFDDRLAASGRPRLWFLQRGYLFLADRAAATRLDQRLALMRASGANVVRLSVPDIRAMLPDLHVDDLEFGILGPDDGYLNPGAALQTLRSAATDAGVQFLEATVTAVRRAGGRIAGVSYEGGRLDTGAVVNAAGPLAARVAGLAGVTLPVAPVRQQLFRCELPNVFPYRFPMIVDPGGLHWRHDDALDASAPDAIIVAKTRHDEPEGENFDCDVSRWSADFQPDLARRMPALENARMTSGWAGLYEMSPDHHPILGEHDELRGFYLANGFSGHGLMMAPATGALLSELIRTGTTETADIRALGVGRFARGALLDDPATI